MPHSDACKVALARLDKIIADFEEYRRRAPHDDLSGTPEDGISALYTRATSAIEGIAGTASPYADRFRVVDQDTLYLGGKLIRAAGILRGLREDVASGYLTTVEELAHADVFADFLEMAEHLIQTGYKDAAAVIVGSSLESHLRKLCVRHGVSPTADNGRPKKADTMNAELAKQGVYNKLVQKTVTAWLDLRNKAAHGHYDQYDKAQVEQLLTGVRDLMTRHPA